MNMRILTRGVVLLAIALLVLPFIIRFISDRPLVVGSEGYGHLRIAETIAQKGIPAYDPAMPERYYVVNPFDLVLAGGVKLIGALPGALLLPFLLGMGTVWCMISIVRRWKISQPTALCVVLVFVLSPFFVDVFTQPTPRALEFFLFVLLVALLAPVPAEGQMRSWARTLAAVACGAVLAWLGMIPAFFAVILPPLARTIRRTVPQRMLFASGSALLVLFAHTLPMYLQTESPAFAKPMLAVHAISDFGSAHGLSLFAWLLALIGLVLLWRFKKTYYAAMIAISITLMSVLLLPSALVFGHVVIAFLAGYTLAFFSTMRWSFEDIRVLTLVVLMCGLLFSTLAHGMALAQGMPNNEIKRAAMNMQDILAQDATLLTHPDHGFWFSYWSGRQVFLDGWLAQTPDVNKRWETAQGIWHAQDIMRLRPLLFKNEIDAVVITQDMREGLVWDVPEQDILFLLRNNETFKNAYRSSSVDIWAVLRPNSSP